MKSSQVTSLYRMLVCSYVRFFYVIFSAMQDAIDIDFEEVDESWRSNEDYTKGPVRQHGTAIAYDTSEELQALALLRRYVDLSPSFRKSLSSIYS